MPESENLEALAWLERSLEHVRERGHIKAESLLRTVLDEVLFELDFAGEAPNNHLAEESG